MRKVLTILFFVSLVSLVLAMNWPMPEQFFVSGGRLIYVSGDHVTEDSTTIEVNLQIPSVQGLSDKAFQESFNTRLESEIQSYKEDIVDQAAKGYEASKGAEWPFRKYNVYVVYSAYLSEGILSIDMIWSEFTGGAHPNAARRTYNIDVSKNRFVSLEDLLGSDYAEKLNGLLRQKISSRDDLWLEEFKGVKPDQGYYLKGGKLYIYFQPYDIGPWSSGMPEFSFDFSDLK